MVSHHRKAEISAATSQQVSFLKTEIESELETRILPEAGVPGWGAEVLVSTPDQQAMQSDANLVMSSYPAYQALERVRSCYFIRKGGYCWRTCQSGRHQKEPGR